MVRAVNEARTAIQFIEYTLVSQANVDEQANTGVEQPDLTGD
jgi:hypothetical protein